MPTTVSYSAPSGASTPHAFTPEAIIARAHAHAAGQAARAGKSIIVLDLTPTDALAALAAGIDAAESIAPSASAASGLSPKAAPERIARRVALAGAAAALFAPLAPRSAAARVAEADAELARLADEIDRTLDGAAYALEPVHDEDDQNRRLRHAERLMLRMVDVPAVGLAGVKAKAKGYLDSVSYDVLESAALAQSLAEDAERVCGEVLA